jgi:hypothetical protein
MPYSSRLNPVVVRDVGWGRLPAIVTLASGGRSLRVEREGDGMRRGGVMSTQFETRPSAEPTEQRDSNWLVVAVVALVAALVGLGAGYLLFDTDSGDEVPPNVEALLADYWAAAAAGDGDAVLALLTDDAAFFRWELPAQESGLREAISGWSSLVVRRIGDPVVVDKYGSYVIAQRGSMLDDEILYLIRTAEEDGELKIDSLTPYYDAG